MTKTPGLFGYHMLPRDVMALLYGAGWREPLNMVRMAATVDAESDSYTGAIGKINFDGSQDWGMFQLNSYHWSDYATSPEEFYLLAIDPPRAAAVARLLFERDKRNGGTGFGPWFAYGTQRYTDRLSIACRGLCNFAGLQTLGTLIL